MASSRRAELALVGALWLVATSTHAQEAPFRLETALESPAWLRFGLTHRTRYEHLFDQPRAGAPGEDAGLALRTTVRAEVGPESFSVGLELIDSRLHFTDENTPLDTSHIDPVDVLRAYVALAVPDVGLRGATLRARAGRLTMDLGSRRLVARNGFRNTINAFGGVDLEWISPARDAVRVFAVVPVNRLPATRAQLADHAIELDREVAGAILFGVWVAPRPLPGDVRTEAYALGLHERDADPLVPTRDRRIVTPGVRVFRPPGRGRVDLDLEVIGQLGVSRASLDPLDVTDLDHLALFAHAAVGYALDLSWLLRAEAMLDYASGDASPDDRAQGRFDSLFGGRRFDLGPAGLYGLLSRGNLLSPGVRVETAPHPLFDAFVVYRLVWLAEARDAWPATGLRDPSGGSGDFVGHQLEARARVRFAGSLGVEVGYAQLFRGPFAIHAPRADVGGDPIYLYAAIDVEL